jgi:hypothetical protein
LIAAAVVVVDVNYDGVEQHVEDYCTMNARMRAVMDDDDDDDEMWWMRRWRWMRRAETQLNFWPPAFGAAV